MKTWDFLQDRIPKLEHPDETLSEMKPQAAAPATQRERMLPESQAPGPERSKGLTYATATHRVVGVQSHTRTL